MYTVYREKNYLLKSHNLGLLEAPLNLSVIFWLFSLRDKNKNGGYGRGTCALNVYFLPHCIITNQYLSHYEDSKAGANQFSLVVPSVSR